MSFVEKTEATAKLITANKKVVTVIGTDSIRSSFEPGCLQQITNIADAPGIDETVLNPDGHQGYGCPVGSVFASRDMIYPNAVGPDVKCSMSFLQLHIPHEALNDKSLRRALINALEARIPLGAGSRQAPKARKFAKSELVNAAIDGAGPTVLSDFGIPAEWAEKCEDAKHGDCGKLFDRIEEIGSKNPVLYDKLIQMGSVGGGNHFMECNSVKVAPGMENEAKVFGLMDGHIGFLNHFGSRGFGYFLTSGGRGYPGQFRLLAEHFEKWRIPFPGGDSHNVYVPYGTKECDDYLNDMNLGANFATVNHLLVCTYILEAFEEVLGKIGATFVYYIAHNIIRREAIDGTAYWVHRKGATRALWAGHHELKDTEFYKTGHPILLPGNPIDGSTIMVGRRGSRRALCSVNHGAGRSMSRRKAVETFNKKDVNAHFDEADILTNCRQYPVDESRGSYKPYAAVIDSVEKAGLATTVATLKPRMIIKDGDQSAEGAA